MGFDHDAIRNRLIELKNKRKMKNIDFCRIYAPEKCNASDANAENYISAVFTGRHYPKETSGPVKIELDYLQNLVDSKMFPGLTMNYLLYGDDTPAVVEEVIDLDINKWTLADFCELIGRLKLKYPKSIEIKESIEFGQNRFDENNRYGEDCQRRSVIISIEEMNDIDFKPAEREFCLGQALSLFHHMTKETENLRDDEIRRIGYEKAVEEMRKKKQFIDTNLSNCDNERPFIIFYGE